MHPASCAGYGSLDFHCLNCVVGIIAKFYARSSRSGREHAFRYLFFCIELGSWVDWHCPRVTSMC